MGYAGFSYICMPFFSNRENLDDRLFEEKINVDLAKRLAKYLYKLGKIPIMPHLLLEIYDTNNSKDVKLINKCRKRMIKNSDEIVTYGNIDCGMEDELYIAENYGLSVLELDSDKTWIMS